MFCPLLLTAKVVYRYCKESHDFIRNNQFYNLQLKGNFKNYSKCEPLHFISLSDVIKLQ